MSINNNYKQEYLNACIYKVHKTDKWAKVYEQTRMSGLNMTPKDMFDFIEDDIDCPVDVKKGLHGRTLVVYKSLQDALTTENCHIFMDSGEYFIIDKGNLENFSYDYRKESNRVSNKIVITEIVPQEARQKLLLITNNDADRSIVCNIITSRLNIELDKIRFVMRGRLHIYVDIITKNIQERIDLASVLSHNEDEDNNIIDEDDIINLHSKKTYTFELPKTKICNNILYYEHVFTSNIAETIISDFDKYGRLCKNTRNKFHLEFKSRILVDDSIIEDSEDEDKMVSTIVNNYNYSNCSVVHCSDANNISNASNNTNKNVDLLEKLGTKLDKTCKESTFSALKDLLEENNFNVKSSQDIVELISKMGYKKYKNYWTHAKNIPKNTKKNKK
jgi:hypothetical protein